MLDLDLQVFFDTEGFAVDCVRTRLGVGDVAFAAILSAVDDSVLDGYFSAAGHSLRFASEAVELAEDDQVVSGGDTYRVLRSTRVNDGLESLALLALLAPLSAP